MVAVVRLHVCESNVTSHSYCIYTIQQLYVHVIVHLTELSLLCKQRVKKIYEDLEEEPPVYFYMRYEADAIGVNCEGSTWPLENSELIHQVPV